MTAVALRTREWPRHRPGPVEDPAEHVEDFASRSKSAATIRACASGWRDFVAFCAERELSALPASDQTVAMYLSAVADRGAKAATLARRLLVISQAHKGADLPSPTTSSLVHCVHAGVRRTIGTAQVGKPRRCRRPTKDA